jgi:hypothetical protein
VNAPPKDFEGLVSYVRIIFDPVDLRALALRHGRSGSERKYIWPEPWLAKKWAAIELLDLHRSHGLSILDLGTGPGHFPIICRYLGHDCEALDQPGIPLYDDLCRLAGLERIDHAIRPGQPLPRFERRFDLVTAFMLGFNTRPDGTLFSLDDWQFFLDDVRDNVLTPGGHLCLKMIRQAKRSGLKYGDPELMALFEARGARFLPKHRFALFQPLR